MSQSKKIKNSVKPELPGGFRDYGPGEARMKQWILDTARGVFERFGFEMIETSAGQRTEVLTGGEADSQKIIFNLNPSTSPVRNGISNGASSENKNAESDLSLRFDLTVPLARFIAANPEILKPFKRYEIGRVWRGERQQAGRFREFTQADIDIVGSASPDADAEIVAIMYATLKALNVGEFIIKINDRRVLNELPRIAGFDEEKLWDALRIADKKDRIGQDGVLRELTTAFDSATAEKIIQFMSEPLDLPEIKTRLEAMQIPQNTYRFDRSLVRGLSYYTGTVFEAILADAPEVGSVFGGGRYDNLVMNFTGQKIPAVGASLGVDRLMAAFEKMGRSGKAGAKTQVLVLDLVEELKSEYMEIATNLRDAGINTALYLGEDKAFQAQLAYALKKEVTYVLIYGEEEKKKGVVAIKNLATKKQEDIAKADLVKYLRL